MEKGYEFYVNECYFVWKQKEISMKVFFRIGFKLWKIE